MKFELIISWLLLATLDWSHYGAASPPAGPTQTLLMYLRRRHFYLLLFSPMLFWPFLNLDDPGSASSMMMTMTMMTMTMTMMTMQEDRMMVDTEYSSDNNGADPAFTNYTHSHIPRIIVMI